MPILDTAAYLNETLVLDPVSEDALNSPLTLTSDPYGLMEHHYPQPAIDPQWASSVSTEGAVLASQRYQNREISITVDVSTLTGLRSLQAKLTKLAREGGTLQRTMSDTTVIVFDVLTTDGYDPSFDQTWHLGTITTVSFTLTCKPFGRGVEIAKTAHVESATPVLRFVETGIKGDVPAIGRLEISSGSKQAWAIWGMRSRYYDSASTARLYIEAESTGLGSSATVSVGTPTGAAGGSSVSMPVILGTGATNRNALNFEGTHIGTYRVFARVQDKSTNTGTSSLQLIWYNQGEGRTTNSLKTLNQIRAGAWQLVDLGLITARPGPIGSAQGWHMEISAYSTRATSGDILYFDNLMLVPVDEGSGQSISVTPLQQFPINGGGARKIVIDSTGVFSELAGTVGRFGRSPAYSGDYLRIPVAGAGGRSVEFIARLVVGGTDSFGTSFAEFDDAVTDFVFSDTTAQLFYTPRYLSVPAP